MWSTGLSIVLGVAAALAIARSPTLSTRVLDSLFMSPLVLPALAFGLSALMLFSLVGLPVSPLTLVIGHTVVCVPYVVRNTVAALAQLESMWQDLEGKLDVTIAALSGVLIIATVALMAIMERVTGLSKRLTS